MRVQSIQIYIHTYLPPTGTHAKYIHTKTHTPLPVHLVTQVMAMMYLRRILHLYCDRTPLIPFSHTISSKKHWEEYIYIYIRMSLRTDAHTNLYSHIYLCIYLFFHYNLVRILPTVLDQLNTQWIQLSLSIYLFTYKSFYITMKYPIIATVNEHLSPSISLCVCVRNK